jgi:hypothetical protein
MKTQRLYAKKKRRTIKGGALTPKKEQQKLEAYNAIKEKTEAYVNGLTVTPKKGPPYKPGIEDLLKTDYAIHKRLEIYGEYRKGGT